MRRSTLLHFAPLCSLLLLLAAGAAGAQLSGIKSTAFGAKSWREPVATAASLPSTGNTTGDARVTKDTGIAWVWTGSTWVSGTTGPQGPQGIQGPPGPQGATGSQGATGPQGPQGNPGAAGAAGATWLSGTAAPSSGQGADGDFYYRTSTGDVYGKTSEAWSILANLIGPQGPQGVAGATGPQGPSGSTGATGATGAAGPAGADGAPGATGATGATGPTGPAGAAGVDGKTVRNGSGAPSSGLGIDGDFYLDTTAHTIYGPKASGAWGSSTSLVGPTGDTGPTGATGAAGATGPAGSVSSLTNGHILVGNVSNAPTDVAVSGDASIANTGAVSITALHTLPPGSLSAPSVPVGESGTGFHLVGTGQLGVTANGVQVLQLLTAASGVNFFTMTSSATGGGSANGPTLKSTGSDSSVDMNFDMKGTSSRFQWKVNGVTKMDYTDLGGGAFALRNSSGPITVPSGKYVGSDSNNNVIFSNGGNWVEIKGNGVLGMRVSDTAVTTNVRSVSAAQVFTVADNGNGGTRATATLTPTTSYVTCSVSDPQGADITISETGAVDGQILRIVNIGTNVCGFADTAGVTELAGAVDLGQYDSLVLLYVSDRWVEISRSNN